MRRRLAALSAALVCVGAWAQDAEEPAAKEDAPPPCAFGYCMGQAIESEPNGKSDRGVPYIAKDHNFFYKVVAYWTPATGVCNVKGIYVVPSPDDYGEAHRSAFNHISDLVGRKYGEPSDAFDFLDAGSLWDEPRYWLMGLKSGERLLQRFWAKKPSILPSGLGSISVKASELLIVVDYEFVNFPDCVEEGEASLADDF